MREGDLIKFKTKMGSTHYGLFKDEHKVSLYTQYNGYFYSGRGRFRRITQGITTRIVTKKKLMLPKEFMNA